MSALSPDTPPAHPSRLLLRLSLAGSFALAAPALILFFQPFYLSGRLFYSKKALASAMGAGFGAVLLLAILILTWTPWWDPLQRKLRAGFGLLQRLGRLNFLFVVGGISLLGFLVAGPPHDYFRDTVVRVFVLWLAALSGSLFLGAAGAGRTWVERLGLGLLLAAAGYRIAAYASDVSTFPFSLYWSEASRYYYASLFAAQRLYGFSLPPSVLHPTRYLMQAVPFLIQNSPLWLHRLWQVLLWIGVTAVTAWSLARRLAISERPRRLDAGRLGLPVPAGGTGLLPPPGAGHPGAAGVRPPPPVALAGGRAAGVGVGRGQPRQLVPRAGHAGGGAVFHGVSARRTSLVALPAAAGGLDPGRHGCGFR